MSLMSYTDGPLCVGDELNKFAANIAIGRNHAAVHWRSDYTQSLLLGEAVALSTLNDQLEIFRTSGSTGTSGGRRWRISRHSSCSRGRAARSNSSSSAMGRTRT